MLAAPQRPLYLCCIVSIMPIMCSPKDAFVKCLSCRPFFFLSFPEYKCPMMRTSSEAVTGQCAVAFSMPYVCVSSLHVRMTLCITPLTSPPFPSLIRKKASKKENLPKFLLLGGQQKQHPLTDTHKTHTYIHHPGQRYHSHNWNYSALVVGFCEEKGKRGC